MPALRERLGASRVGWVLALLAPAAGLALSPGGGSLADPRTCLGAPDIIAIGLARLMPHLAVGTLLWALHGIATIAAGVTLWWLITRTLRTGPLMSAAMACGFALTPPFAFVLGVTPAAALAISALAIGFALHEPAPLGGRPSTANAVVWLAVATIAPVLAPATAVAALVQTGGFGAARRRRLRTAGLVLALLGLSAVVPSLAPSGLPPVDATAHGGCLSLAGPAPLASLAVTYSSTGPLLLALAALGAFSLRASRGSRRTATAVVFVGGALLTASATEPTSAEVLAPVIVAVWALAAAGLRELTGYSDVPAGRPVAALLTAAAIPVLFWADAATRPADPDRVPLGHASLTRDHVADMLAALPDRSALVAEDEATDLLLRSLDGWWQQTGKAIVKVAHNRDAIAAILPAYTVYALPSAQRDLQHRGLRLTTDGSPPVPELALVEGAASCVAITSAWSDAAAAAGLDHLAVVADSALARGPYVIYAAGLSPFSPSPAGWSERTRRGFFAQTFDTTDGAARADLIQLLEDDGVTAPELLIREHFLTRLELWRTPDASLLLPVSLGTRADRLRVQRTASAYDAPARLCPSFPFAPRGFGL